MPTCSAWLTFNASVCHSSWCVRRRQCNTSLARAKPEEQKVDELATVTFKPRDLPEVTQTVELPTLRRVMKSEGEKPPLPSRRSGKDKAEQNR